MNPARCHLHRHDFFRRLVDTQVQLAPGSSPTTPMLSYVVPLTGTVHFQACGIHDDVSRSNTWTDRQRRHYRALSSAQRAVVRDRKIESQ